MSTTTRRTVLLGAAVVAASTAAAALALASAHGAAAAEPESEIMALFREWKRIEALRSPDNLSDEEVNAWIDAVCDERWAIEERIITLTPTMVQELAAQITAVTVYGDLPFEPKAAKMIVGLLGADVLAEREGSA